MRNHTFMTVGTLFALAAGLPARAGYYTNGAWSTSSDEGTAEVYGDAIDDYSGTGSSNLAQCINGTWDWIDEMDNAGFGNYRYSTDDDAWSLDLEASGLEDTYGDAGDFSYFSGHGSTGKAKFNGSSGDDLYDTETELGDNDLEVSAFDSCQTLNASGRTDFISANRDVGIHFLVGFDSNAKDIRTTADNFGDYLDKGYTIRSAWISATMDGHSSSYKGAYVRFANSACNTYSDAIGSWACDPQSSSSAYTATWTL